MGLEIKLDAYHSEYLYEIPLMEDGIILLVNMVGEVESIDVTDNFFSVRELLWKARGLLKSQRLGIEEWEVEKEMKYYKEHLAETGANKEELEEE